MLGSCCWLAATWRRHRSACNLAQHPMWRPWQIRIGGLRLPEHQNVLCWAAGKPQLAAFAAEESSSVHIVARMFAAAAWILSEGRTTAFTGYLSSFASALKPALLPPPLSCHPPVLSCSTLLSWLAGIFHGISGSQAIIHGELLQPEFTASGMVAPFVQPVPAPSTGARFGVPSSTDVLCDNVSELLR